MATAVGGTNGADATSAADGAADRHLLSPLTGLWSIEHVHPRHIDMFRRLRYFVILNRDPISIVEMLRL